MKNNFDYTNKNQKSRGEEIKIVWIFVNKVFKNSIRFRLSFLLSLWQVVKIGKALNFQSGWIGLTDQEVSYRWIPSQFMFQIDPIYLVNK